MSQNEITLDAVSQINKMHGKPVSAKRVETNKVEAAPRTVICSGSQIGKTSKKGNVEQIQVLVQSVGGVKLTPPQTKFFQRKNDQYPWADREGNVFMTAEQIKEAEAREWALAQAAMTPEDRERDLAARVARARAELMNVVGVTTKRLLDSFDEDSNERE
ncbi:MAG: hypothetical protein HY226_06060 [Candidatus Vogelbacteria bacterium]|nr:hypothetical protein [Candidatus Vogelbacteria bacterium]